MIVFGPTLSPFVRKVRVFAAEKGIALEERPGRGSPPDPDFLAASPFRKIPALKDGDFLLSDSSAIVAYMEKLHPEPPLIPSEARAHARTIWFDEFADTILGAATLAIFFNRVMAARFGREPDLAAADRAEAEQLPPAFDYLESELRGSGFLVEDRLTLADIAVASFFPNLGYVRIAPDAKSHPKLAAYISAMLARPSFAGFMQADQAILATRPAA